MRNAFGFAPADVGGIAELKWIAEYADLHLILMAPHGTANRLLSLAALIQVCATLPHNFIAFEYTTGDPDWWYDIVDGLPQTIVKDGFIDVIDRQGMDVDLVPERARRVIRRKMTGPSSIDRLAEQSSSFIQLRRASRSRRGQFSLTSRFFDSYIWSIMN